MSDKVEYKDEAEKQSCFQMLSVHGGHKCMVIFEEITEEEIKKFPACIRNAWAVGKSLSDLC